MAAPFLQRMRTLLLGYVAASENSSLMASSQFFGQVDIDGRSKDMIVSLKDIDGATVFSQRLHARVEWRGFDA